MEVIQRDVSMAASCDIRDYDRLSSGEKDDCEQNGGDTNCTWSVRRGLRTVIIQRRQASGQPDISQDEDSSDSKQGKEYELTPRELELRELRKKNNRAAALKWRKRRKDFNDHLSQLMDVEEKRKKVLVHKINKLVSEKSCLETVWRDMDTAHQSAQDGSTEALDECRGETDSTDLTCSQSSIDSAMSLSQQSSGSDGPGSFDSVVSVECTPTETILSVVQPPESSETTSAGENSMDRYDEMARWPLKKRPLVRQVSACSSIYDSGHETDSQDESPE